MGLFGKKDEDKNGRFQMTDEDLDAKILAAIEETDEEEKQRKEEEKQAEADRMKARMSSIPEGAVEVKAQVSKRFFLMTEGAESADDGITVRGLAHGHVSEGDIAFFIRPDDSVSKITVTSIVKKEGEKSSEAFNEEVSMTVKFDDDTDISDVSAAAPGYSVISNVEPQKEINPQRPVENPYLLGLTLEHAKHLTDREFMKNFARQIVMGKFILPVQADLGDSPDGKKKLNLITLTNKEDPSIKHLAVFTDLAAIAGAKGLFADDGKPSVTVMTFPALAKAVTGGCSGMIINPFGPAKVQVPSEFFEKISRRPVVREGSGGRVSPINPNMKPPVKKDILVGKPPVNAETDSIREALVKYVSGIPEVASASLLLKADRNGRGYLFVVDCPKASQKKVFEGIRKATSPFMKEIVSSEAVLYANAPFADGYFRKNSPDYEKKD